MIFETIIAKAIYFLKNIREAHGFEDRGGIAVAQCRRAAVIATSELIFETIIAKAIYFLKNIREARGFEDRGGIAVAQCRRAAVIATSEFRRRCHRLSVRTRDFHSLKRGSIPRGTTDNNKL